MASNVSRTLGSLLVAGVTFSSVAVFSAGCNEYITYSYQARKQGVTLFDQQQYDQAAGAFRNATQQNPRDYVSFYYLGRCYEASGREQQALQSYRTSVAVMPTTFDGRDDKQFRLTAIEALAKCVAGAASQDQEVAALADTAQQTQKANDWFVLARTYVALGDADNAIDAYARASTVAPADAQISKSAALYLEQTGQARRAEPMLRRAYQQNPEDVEVAAALRRIGVVPGPSILDQNQLVSPLVPKGPIPEMELRVKDRPEETPTPRQTAGSTP